MVVVDRDELLVGVREHALHGAFRGFLHDLVDLLDSRRALGDEREIDEAVKKASQGSLKGVLEFIDEPLVSSDFNHNPASSLYDSSLTKVIEGKLVKVCSWYDNEWGFSNRMLDTTLAFAAAK